MPVQGAYTCAVPKPVDCGTIVLPAVKFATCAAAYQAHESEICDIWMIETTDEVADTIPTAWYDPANFGATFDTNSKHLTTIGDKPLSEINEITVAKRWLVFTSRLHTLNFDITDMSIENYDFVRALQVKPTIAIWFRDIDGYMYGGPNGVICDVQNAGNILNRGEGGLLTGQAALVWEADCDPPIAVEGVNPNP